jgi:hypothetical protein
MCSDLKSLKALLSDGEIDAREFNELRKRLKVEGLVTVGGGAAAGGSSSGGGGGGGGGSGIDGAPPSQQLPPPNAPDPLPMPSSSAVAAAASGGGGTANSAPAAPAGDAAIPPVPKLGTPKVGRRQRPGSQGTSAGGITEDEWEGSLGTSAGEPPLLQPPPPGAPAPCTPKRRARGGSRTGGSGGGGSSIDGSSSSSSSSAAASHNNPHHAIPRQAPVTPGGTRPSSRPAVFCARWERALVPYTGARDGPYIGHVGLWRKREVITIERRVEYMKVGAPLARPPCGCHHGFGFSRTSAYS